MKFISVLWILIIITKGAKTKNRIIIYGVQETIGLFPRLPNKGTEFITYLNLPIKTSSKANPTEMYEKTIMQEIPTKEINYKNNDKVISEVTTRRSSMPIKKFTVRLDDVYPQSGFKKYNWYSNRQRRNELPKNKNIHNSNIPENQYNPNSYGTPRSQITKTTLLFRKRNNTKYLKENPEESLSKRLQINNFDSEGRFPLNVIKKSDISIEKKQNITLPTNILNKTDLKDQIDEEITTDSDIKYSVSRLKRSVNIIEEENVATTFSGIQITNQEYQSHDMTFKNIHT